MSTESKVKTIKLTVFDGKDYHVWADKTRRTFSVYEVWDVVSGRSIRPSTLNAEGESEEEAFELNLIEQINEWDHKNDLAAEALVTCLDSNVARLVTELTSAQEIWERLKERFGHVSGMKRIAAERTLHEFKKDSYPNMSMKDYITKFSGLVAELKQLKPAKSEEERKTQTEDVNILFLGNLGEKWQTFHQSVLRDVETMQTEDLYAQVLAFEEAQPKTARSEARSETQTNQNQPSDETKANTSNFRGQSRGKGRGGRGGSGGFRGSGGRGRGNSRGRGRGEQYGESGRAGYGDIQTPNDGKCRRCGDFGHFQRDCYTDLEARAARGRGVKRGRGSYQGGYRGGLGENQENPPSYNYNRSQNDYWSASVAVFNSSISLSSPDSYEWLYDSGANAHIHPDRNRFQDYVKFINDDKSVRGFGGRETKAIGYGSIVLQDHLGHQYLLKNVVHAPAAENPILCFNKFRKLGFDLIFDSDGDTFKLESQSHVFQLFGRAVDDILHINEQHGSYKANMVITRAKKRLHVELEDDVENGDDVDGNFAGDLVSDQIQPISERRAIKKSKKSSASSKPKANVEKLSRNVEAVIWHNQLAHSATSSMSKIST